MSEEIEQHDAKIKKERTLCAAEFLKQLPSFPLNVIKVQMLLEYDDGLQLLLDLEERERT